MKPQTVDWVNERLPSLPEVPTAALFAHIPLPEFIAAWNKGSDVRGTKGEFTCCPSCSSGVLAAMRCASMHLSPNLHLSYVYNLHASLTRDLMRTTQKRVPETQGPCHSHSGRSLPFSQLPSLRAWCDAAAGLRDCHESVPSAALALAALRCTLQLKCELVFCDHILSLYTKLRCTLALQSTGHSLSAPWPSAACRAGAAVSRQCIAAMTTTMIFQPSGVAFALLTGAPVSAPSPFCLLDV